MLFNRSNKDMGFHEEYVCNIGLGLGLSYDQENLDGSFKSHNKKPCFRFDSSTTTLEPSLALGLSDETTYQQVAGKLDMNKAYEESSRNIDVHWQTSPNSTTVSSFSNTRVKREKELGFEDIEVEKLSSRVSDEDEEGSARKKLRLTKEQSALLEDSFKEHSTLNPKQKQALAKQLSLRPRQVEVWFQNRRARTKLKQTEVDCEFLKKCCENLTEENRRLHKELQELKALKLSSQPLYMQLPAATLSMCPSCERIGNGGSTGSGGDGGSSKNNPFTNIAVPKQAHFFSPFNNHSSAAC